MAQDGASGLGSSVALFARVISRRDCAAGLYGRSPCGGVFVTRCLACGDGMGAGGGRSYGGRVWFPLSDGGLRGGGTPVRGSI